MDATANGLPALLTRAETAAALRMKPQSLAAGECRGRPLLPVIRIGGRRLYRAADVNELIRRNTAGTATTTTADGAA